MDSIYSNTLIFSHATSWKSFFCYLVDIMKERDSATHQHDYHQPFLSMTFEGSLENKIVKNTIGICEYLVLRHIYQSRMHTDPMEHAIRRSSAATLKLAIINAYSTSVNT